jgi:transketolase
MSQSEVRPGFTAAISVSETNDEDARVIEKPFGHALAEAGRKNSKVVGLTADLGKYTDIDIFGQEFPERYFQIGMAEQNLVGVAAGLSRVGYIPFATTYCVFASRRAYDFIAMDVALGRANVKIIAGLPGLTTGYGATHQGIDDLALMRAIPNMVVIDPCDATEIEQAVHALTEYEGPVYMRLLRGTVKAVLNPESYRFEIGKAAILREGQDIALISTGIMTERALCAAEELSKSRIEARVLHVPTLKPVDQDVILQTAAKIGVVLTLENHSTVGGLGSAVAEAIALAGIRVRMAKVGIQDQFIECGSVGYLTDKYGLSTPRVVKAAQDLLARNRSQ